MIKKLLISLLFIAATFLSCKKNSSETPKSNGVGFKVSAPTTFSVTIYIMRGSSAVNTVDKSGLVNPYEYSYNDIQSGDIVQIYTQTAKNNEITGSLSVKGNNIAPSSSSINSSGVSYKSWNYTIN